MKVRFTRDAAAIAYGSMAEGMAEVAQDDFRDSVVSAITDNRRPSGVDTFDADQLNDLAQSIWNGLQKDSHKSHPFYVVIPNHQREFAESVKENCEDSYDTFDESEPDACYVGECILEGGDYSHIKQVNSATAIETAIRALEADMARVDAEERKAYESAIATLIAMRRQRGLEDENGKGWNGCDGTLTDFIDICVFG